MRGRWKRGRGLFRRRMEELPPRSVIREHAFEDELRALIRDALAADEFVEAAEFLLARDPRTGSQWSPGSAVWVMPMAPLEGKSVALFYTFDDAAVCFFSIRAFAY